MGYKRLDRTEVSSKPLEDPPPVKERFPFNKYKMRVNPKASEFHQELLAFKLDWGPEQGGLGKFEHLQRAVKMALPKLEWNPWLERQLRGFCNLEHLWTSGHTRVRTISLAGVAGAGKTFSTGLYAFFWFIADPLRSIAILTSTSKLNLGQRVWPVIQDCYFEAKAQLAKRYRLPEESVDMGNMVASQKMLQAKPGDAKHAIFAQAVKDGETAKAEAFIRGQHAERILISIDEAGETPQAIYSAISNLRKACLDLTIIISDNTTSRLTPHGRCCTPKGGWNQKPIHQTEWRTEGIPEWQIESGLCLQFKGAESPNVKAGKTVFKHIYSYEDYKASQRPGVINTLAYWKYDAGEWAPDGICNTCFDETMCIQCGITEKVLFVSTPVAVSFCDPGFGGDACIQVISLLGDVETNMVDPKGAFPGAKKTKQVLMITETLELELNPNAKDEHGYLIDYAHQISRQIIANCERFHVEPDNFGIWATGVGEAAATVLYSDWSPLIFKAYEGGSPSDLPVSEDDPRPAMDKYDRRVTEIWFSGANMARAGQLKGVPMETVIELCQREYEMIGKPAKYRIETKDEFKPKLGHSCDKSDATLGACELVRVRHGVRGMMEGKAVNTGRDDWNDRVRGAALAMQGSYSSDNASEQILAYQSI